MRGTTRLALPAILAVGLTMVTAGSAWATVPGNDDFANATVISVTPYTDATVNTADATTQDTDWSGCAGSNSVWYAYTATHDGTLTFDTFGSSFDTLLSAYTGTEGSLTLLACNDDANGTPQSQVGFDVTSGTTYHFMVAGCCRPGDGTVGDVVVHADVTGPPFSFDVSFTSGSIDMKTREVTVDGTVVCNGPGVVDVVGALRQRLTEGTFSAETACSTDASTFTAVVVPSADSFQPGKATIHDVVISGCGTNGCDTRSLDDLETTVKLHP